MSATGRVAPLLAESTHQLALAAHHVATSSVEPEDRLGEHDRALTAVLASLAALQNAVDALAEYVDALDQP